VETAGSLIEQLLPKSIHAVTSQGFELKVALFVIASSLNCYFNLQPELFTNLKNRPEQVLLGQDDAHNNRLPGAARS
jgi:hypothetical protein